MKILISRKSSRNNFLPLISHRNIFTIRIWAYSKSVVIKEVLDNGLMDRMKGYLGSMNPSKNIKEPSSQITTIKGKQVFTEKSGKQQSYIYYGYLFELAEEDRIPLKIMNQLLSERLGFNLREKKGLAYSIGSSVSFQGDYGWLVASMGTRPERLNEAKEGIIEEIDKLKKEKLTEKEVQKNINALVGRILMRRLPRVNQAYFMGYLSLMVWDMIITIYTLKT